MNILMISDVYYPRVNGVSTSIATFRKSLHVLGHRTVLLAPEYPGFNAIEDGVIRVASRYLPFDPEDRFMRMDSLRDKSAGFRPGQFDVIHIHTPFVAHKIGVRLAETLNLPAVETYHTYFEEYFHHYLPVLPRSWLRLAARAASRRLGRGLDGLIVPSLAIERALRAYGIEIPISIIPTGLDLSEFNPGNKQDFCRRYDIATDRPTLVYVGRVAHEKNIAFLIDVIDHIRLNVPDIQFVIAGEGPAKKALRRQVERQGLAENVVFLGYLDRGQALWDCYAAGDAFVFASKTETQGLVLLEAMALGIPVVSTAELGTHDVLKNCNGAVIAQCDVEDFSTKTLQLLQDPALRVKLGHHARSDVLRWSSPKITEDLVSYYYSVVKDYEVMQAKLPGTLS